MRIRWLSHKKREEAKRELTSEEKEIMLDGGYIGFIAGMLFTGIIWWSWWFSITHRIILR
jgi:hypothetical protein